MANTNNDNGLSDREFSGKILSASFALLGFLIGFYGIISSAIGEAGPLRDKREALLPFLAFMSVAIILDCVLGILAVLGAGGILRVRIALTVLGCAMLAIISIFIFAHSYQLWFLFE